MLRIVRGSAGVLKGDGTPISPAYSGLAIGPGDQVGTFSRSDARVDLADGSRIELGSETTVIFHELDVAGDHARVAVEQSAGIAVYRVAPSTGKAETFRILGGARTAMARRADGTTDRLASRQRIDPSLVALAVPSDIGLMQGPGSFLTAPFADGEVLVVTTEQGDTIFMVLSGKMTFPNGFDRPFDLFPGGAYISQRDGTEDFFSFDATGNIFDLVGRGLRELQQRTRKDEDEPVVNSARRRTGVVDEDLDERFEAIDALLTGTATATPSVSPTTVPTGTATASPTSVAASPTATRTATASPTATSSPTATPSPTPPPPRVSISTTVNRFTEPAVGQRNEVIAILLDRASNVPVTVDVTFRNGTANFNADFETNNGQTKTTVTFNPGETVKTVPFLVNSGGGAEGIETFFVDLANAVNATLDATSFLFEITDP